MTAIWTTPRTWVAAETVDEDHMNEQIRDNEDYLKAEVDKLDDVSHAEPARAIDGTVYTNSTKIRLVTITVEFTGDATSAAKITVYTDSSNPPTTVVALAGADNPDSGEYDIPVTFVVLPSEYYKVSSSVAGGGATTLRDWHEWDLH